jgi:hypothetical protein
MVPFGERYRLPPGIKQEIRHYINRPTPGIDVPQTLGRVMQLLVEGKREFGDISFDEHPLPQRRVFLALRTGKMIVNQFGCPR